MGVMRCVCFAVALLVAACAAPAPVGSDGKTWVLWRDAAGNVESVAAPVDDTLDTVEVRVK